MAIPIPLPATGTDGTGRTAPIARVANTARPTQAVLEALEVRTARSTGYGRVQRGLKVRVVRGRKGKVRVRVRGRVRSRTASRSGRLSGTVGKVASGISSLVSMGPISPVSIIGPTHGATATSCGGIGARAFRVGATTSIGTPSRGLDEATTGSQRTVDRRGSGMQSVGRASSGICTPTSMALRSLACVIGPTRAGMATFFGGIGGLAFRVAGTKGARTRTRGPALTRPRSRRTASRSATLIGMVGTTESGTFTTP